VVLFDDTIAANIAYGACRGADLAQCARRPEAAFLLPLIESLPNGFDTRIGETRSSFRVDSARGCHCTRAAQGCSVLLLDEATSALDSESERFIQLSLERLMRGRHDVRGCAPPVDHRGCRRIVVLEDGRIAEIGRHAEAAGRAWPVPSLYRIQFSKSDHAVAPADPPYSADPPTVS